MGRYDSDGNLRPRWKKKRWWFLIAFGVYLGSYFVPWSIDGPAISCFIGAHETKSDKQAEKYAAAHENDFGMLSAFLYRSDYRIRNFHVKSRDGRRSDDPAGTVTVVFVKDHFNSQCFLLDAIAIDGSIMRIDVFPNPKSHQNDVLSVW